MKSYTAPTIEVIGTITELTQNGETWEGSWDDSNGKA
jgi:hypothetical protein